MAVLASFLPRSARTALVLLGIVAAGLGYPRPAEAQEPVRVIFDTDMGNDVDDALALAMLHALHDRGEVDLLAVTITKDNLWSAPYVDAVNTFYGRGDLPIGVVKNGPTPEDNDMIRVPATRRNADGSYAYPRDLLDGREAPDAVGVLRRTLAAQPDSSVVLVQVGFSTNLSRLLASGPDEASPLAGPELVRRKVRLLSMMAGAFPEGNPEYNVETDIPSARRIFGEWPTPIVASGFEIGESILFPATSIERDFAYASPHPVTDAYRHYLPMPYDRPTWDLTSVLVAVRPSAQYFDLSEPGQVTVDDSGKTHFAPAPDGRVRYLVATDVQRARALEAMMLLSSQPPCLCAAP